MLVLSSAHKQQQAIIFQHESIRKSWKIYISWKKIVKSQQQRQQIACLTTLNISKKTGDILIFVFYVCQPASILLAFISVKYMSLQFF